MRRSLIVILLLAGCTKTTRFPAPPRIETPAELPVESSTVVVPISAPMAELQAAISRELPRRLWSIDKHLDQCAKVKLLGKLGCQVVGQVTRGAIRLSGRGDRLLITMPIHAEIKAEKVGGIASKTATGDAVVHAVARLSIAGNWQPTAKVSIEYDWTKPPGIDLLGQRIEFADKADERLKPIVARLERNLPRQLAALKLRDQLDGIWRKGFAVISLNRDNPPAWMRVTPQRLGFGGYRINGRRLELTLAAEARTETFVGPRPADPVATPLPLPSPIPLERGLRFFIPVLADFHQLEPVVQRVLRKRAARGIRLSGVGPVEATFGHVTIYATDNGRLAVGVEAVAKSRDHPRLSTKGRIWLTALPFNTANSQFIQARDVNVVADTDNDLTDLLIRLFSDASVQASIAEGLRHDFAPDYQKLLGKARAAIGSRREGNFLLSADISSVETGQLKVTGGGLFLPVRAMGKATITYRPR